MENCKWLSKSGGQDAAAEVAHGPRESGLYPEDNGKSLMDR